MSRRRRRLLSIATDTARTLALGLTSVLGALVFASACTSKASAVGAGGECFLATDCAPGLVCIEQANKTRICSDDLSRVAGRTPPDGAVAADAGDEAGEGGVDGALPDVVVLPPPDANVPDTTPPPPDTGPPPPVDSGTD